MRVKTSRHVRLAAMLLAGPALVLAAPAQAETTAPHGVWLNDTGRGAIEIKPCGSALCGHVVWLRDKSDTKGCGRQIIGDLKQVSKDLWDGGWIYSPDKKRNYDVEVKPLADGTLRIKGYAGSKIFSRTMVWTPAPGDIERCDGIQEAKADERSAPVSTATKPAPDVSNPKADVPAAATAPRSIEPEGPQQDPGPVAGTEPQEDSAPEVAATPDDAGPVEPTTSPAPKISREGIAERLAEIERETGYGLKRTEKGNCRLNVPFVVVDFPCKD